MFLNNDLKINDKIRYNKIYAQGTRERSIVTYKLTNRVDRFDDALNQMI